MDELSRVLDYYSLFEDMPSYKIVCPFHDDINPSMIVNLEKNNFYCFGCQASGDAFKFVKLMNKTLDDLQAYKKYFYILKSRKKVKLRTKFVIKHIDNKQATIEAQDYYNGLSQTKWKTDDSEVKKYLIKRGFTAESLILAKAKVNSVSFSYPVIFPMYDNGEFKGWVSRTTNLEIEKKRKYLYNTGFSRRSTLVGNYNASTVVIVEGYMDWLKLRQFGLKNVAALLGWKATSNQVQKLKDAGVKTIVSALDNDTCGKNGTKYLQTIFDVVEFKYTAGVKDPGDLNIETFRRCYEMTKQEMKKRNGSDVRSKGTKRNYR